ncbi:hypothetical protein Tco_0009904 [Tanacetum coccineum]
METQKPLLKDEDCEEVDVHMYRSMIGSLMYLTSSRVDIMFVVCACARYQVNPKVLHLHVVKRIFRYLKGQPKLGLWYPKDSPFDLVAYTDSDYTGASLDRKSTTGGKAKKSVKLMMEKLFRMELELMLVTQNGKKVIISEAFVSRDLKLEDEEGVDCQPNSTIFEQLTLMGSKTTAWNEFSSTMASAIICLATNQKFNFSKYNFESIVRNLDNLSGNFFMYPRFVQVFLNQQLDEVSTHKRVYDAPCHTKKISRNMKRVGKGFSGRVTPLFPTMVVQNQYELGESSAMPTDPHHTPTIIESSTQPQKTQKPRKPKRKDTQVPQPSGPTYIVADEDVHKDLGDSLVRATTTASSLEAEQDNGNITKTRSKATPNESSSLGTTLGGGYRFQETMGDTIAQTRVIDLEKTKTTQANKIASLKRRVKKLEQKKRSRTHELKRLRKVGATARVESFGDESLDDADNEMFDVDTLNSEEVFVAGQNENVVEEIVDDAQVSTAATTVIITTKEVTLAQALADLRAQNPKLAKGYAFRESQNGLLKKKDHPRVEEEIALKLQAEINEEERIARVEKEKIDEANIAWEDIQVKVDVDYQLAKRLQAEEQEQFTIEEKATSFKELLEQTRKHFAAKRAEEKRNKPPTKTQQKKIMITYL